MVKKIVYLVIFAAMPLTAMEPPHTADQARLNAEMRNLEFAIQQKEEKNKRFIQQLMRDPANKERIKQLQKQFDTWKAEQQEHLEKLKRQSGHLETE